MAMSSTPFHGHAMLQRPALATCDGRVCAKRATCVGAANLACVSVYPCGCVPYEVAYHNP